MASGYLTTVSEQDCRLLLAERTIGRVAWCLPSGPMILPISYTTHDGAIFFRTTEEGVLASLDGRVVAFEVDDHDEPTETGWSVLVRGRCERTEQFAPRPMPWAPNHDDVTMMIVVHEITGRSVSAEER